MISIEKQDYVPEEEQVISAEEQDLANAIALSIKEQEEIAKEDKVLSDDIIEAIARSAAEDIVRQKKEDRPIIIDDTFALLDKKITAKDSFYQLKVVDQAGESCAYETVKNGSLILDINKYGKKSLLDTSFSKSLFKYEQQ